MNSALIIGIAIVSLVFWFGIKINIGPIKVKMNGLKDSIKYWRASSQYRKELRAITERVKSANSEEELVKALEDYPPKPSV